MSTSNGVTSWNVGNVKHVAAVSNQGNLYVNWGYPLAPFDDDDGDGLFNTWEENGVDINGDRIIDLVLNNANPWHKDLYIELDFMEDHRPNQLALSHVLGNFSNAPLPNLDGVPGINLHIDVDEQVPIKTLQINRIFFPLRMRVWEHWLSE